MSDTEGLTLHLVCTWSKWKQQTITTTVQREGQDEYVDHVERSRWRVCLTCGREQTA